MNKTRLIILSAPSGSGKTTIARHLLDSGLKLSFSVSACSREKRTNEIDGKDYYFLTPIDFRKKIDEDAFLEWEEVYPDHYYGTLKSEVERISRDGHFPLFDVDVVGGLNIKKYYGDEALAIFVQPPNVTELEKRLRSRSTDTDEKIKMRLDKAIHELSFAESFDMTIINDDLDTALKEASIAVKSFLNQ